MKTESSPPGKLRKRWAAAAFSVIGISVLVTALTSCDQAKVSGSPEGGGKKVRNVIVTEVRSGDLEKVIEVPVSIEGLEITQLVSRLEAYVGKVNVDIGDEVSKGDILAILEVPEILAERDVRLKMLTKSEKVLESTKADMETSDAMVLQSRALLAEQEAMLRLRESELDRIGGLVKKNFMAKEKRDEAEYALDSVKASISRIKADISAAEAASRGKTAEMESAAAGVEVGKAELRKVMADVNYLEIRAPFDGLITERLVHPGAFVRPVDTGGSHLFTIENVATMRAVMFIPINDASQIDSTDEVEVHGLQGHRPNLIINTKPDGKPLTISRFANSLNRGSRMMRVESDLDNPVDPETGVRLLKPGGYGKANLTLNRYPGIDIVPEGCIVEGEAGTRVVLVNATSAVKFVPVQVIITTAGESGITHSGNSLAGQKVIVKGAVDFKDGEDLSTDSISNLEK